MKKSTSSLSPKKLIELYRQALMDGSPIENLEKKINKKIKRVQVSKQIETDLEKNRTEEVKQRLPVAIRLGAVVLPILFITVGVYLVGNVVVPITGYYINTLPDIQTQTLTPPIPSEEILDVTPLVVTQQLVQTDQAETTVLGSNTNLSNDGPVIVDTKLDYTNLTNWFEGIGIEQLTADSAGEAYTIDIPSLDVANARVVIGGTDLNASLIAYPGTASPGNLGAPVIFGHSVLRQFYSPSEKNSRRYNSIFSTIMTLKNGDVINVTRDGVKYKYLVRSKTEVKPEDTYILAQNYDSKLLKLVTCTPEGTYLRRGIVTAELVPG